MPRGRKPKPAALRIIEGNPRQKPIPNPPQPRIGDLPEPPDFLPKNAKEEWVRVAVELHRLGILTQIDTAAFGAYCESYSTWRGAVEAIERDGVTVMGAHGNVVKHPMISVAREAAAAMMRYAESFGMTPAGRMRLAVGPLEKKQSKFDNLLAG